MPWVLYLISFTPVSGGRAWSLVTAKVDFNGTVLKQNNFSAYCCVVDFYVPKTCDQRMVTKSFQDMVENFNGKKMAFLVLLI